jgi:hypothetical protein
MKTCYEKRPLIVRLVPRSAVARCIKACVISLSSMLLANATAAQTPHGPIEYGRQLQPTPEQFESMKDENVVEWKRWNAHVQSDVDRLYEEIMRAASPHER